MASGRARARRSRDTDAAQRSQTRHLFPPDDPAHAETPWCHCKPVRRVSGRTVLFIHRPTAAKG